MSISGAHTYADKIKKYEKNSNGQIDIFSNACVWVCFFYVFVFWCARKAGALAFYMYSYPFFVVYFLYRAYYFLTSINALLQHIFLRQNYLMSIRGERNWIEIMWILPLRRLLKIPLVLFKNVPMDITIIKRDFLTNIIN